MQIGTAITKNLTLAISKNKDGRAMKLVSIYIYVFMVKEYKKHQTNFLLFITEP